MHKGTILRVKMGWAGTCQDMSQQLIYSKQLSRGQHRYGMDADWGVVGMHIGATW